MRFRRNTNQSATATVAGHIDITDTQAREIAHLVNTGRLAEADALVDATGDPRCAAFAAFRYIDQESHQQRQELADAVMMRDFNQRSAEHIAAKRDLAEAAITSWDRDEISGDTAVLLIKRALADGPLPDAAEKNAQADHYRTTN
jgi:hypothetical protein